MLNRPRKIPQRPTKSLEHIKKAVKSEVHVTRGSALLLGGGVSLDGLFLDGSASLMRDSGNEAFCAGFCIKNAGARLVALSEMGTDLEKIRGYGFESRETYTLEEAKRNAKVLSAEEQAAWIADGAALGEAGDEGTW